MKKIFFYIILFCLPMLSFAQTETNGQPTETTGSAEAVEETQNGNETTAAESEGEDLQSDSLPASESPSTSDRGNLSSERQRELQSIVKPSDNIIYQGEMFIRFALGMSVPLFSHFFNNPELGNNGYTNNAKLYGLPIGGSAAIDFMYYLEGNWGVGIELALQILQTQANYQSLVAVGARGQYMIRRWPFDIPISVGLGVAFNSLYIEDTENRLYAGPYIKPDFGFFYNINEKWSVGFNTTFWVVSEFYFSEDKKNQSNFSAFWDITLSARYRF